ncbi:MAG: hypothetical protein E7491_03575 [Ruminococcaceae bacterium]|nr:hypothetical protein [Oscillospiraceae bacterium]
MKKLTAIVLAMLTICMLFTACNENSNSGIITKPSEDPTPTLQECITITVQPTPADSKVVTRVKLESYFEEKYPDKKKIVYVAPYLINIDASGNKVVITDTENVSNEIALNEYLDAIGCDFYLYFDWQESAAYKDNIFSMFGGGHQIELVDTYSDYLKRKVENEQVDIIHAGYVVRVGYVDLNEPLLYCLSNSFFSDVTGFIKNSLIYKKNPKNYWKSLSCDGKIYGIMMKNFDFVSCARELEIDGALMEAAGYKVEDFTGQIEKDYEKLKEMQKYKKEGTKALLELKHKNVKGITSIRNKGFASAKTGEDKIFNLYEKEEIKEYFKFLQRVNADELLEKDFFMSGNINNVAKYQLDYLDDNYEQPNIIKEFLAASNTEYYKISIFSEKTQAVNAKTAVGVAEKSENKAEAFKVLELLYTDEKAKNILIYGNEEGNGKANNLYQITLDVSINEEVYEQAIENVELSPICGFWYFDNAETWAELAKIEAEYEGLWFGEYEDVDATLAELNAKLYEAGLQTLLDDINAQYKAWKGIK